MTYYLLPRTPKNIINHIECQLHDDVPDNFLSHSLSNYISSIKERITPIESQWTNTKNTSIHMNLSILLFLENIKPSQNINHCQGHFLMIELIHIFDIGTKRTY